MSSSNRISYNKKAGSHVSRNHDFAFSPSQRGSGNHAPLVEVKQEFRPADH